VTSSIAERQLMFGLEIDAMTLGDAIDRCDAALSEGPGC